MVSPVRSRTSPAPTLVIVPGVGDSGPDHWQSCLERSHAGAVRVAQQDWSWPVRSEWVHALARTLAALEGPLILVGHSAGAVTIAHWAADPLACESAAVVGALLVAPADLETELPDGTPVDFLEDAGWIPGPRRRLPFASILVASTDDPYASIERSSVFAEAWGSRLVNLGPAGHINAEAGFGDWPLAEELLDELVAAAQSAAV
jgi:uncharacterized protein